MTKARRRRSGTRPAAAEARTERQAIVEREFRSDLASWIDLNPRIAAKVLTLVEDVMRSPFSGIGKPEPLSYDRAHWSRRITQEHRLVYRVTDVAVLFVEAAGHYSR